MLGKHKSRITDQIRLDVSFSRFEGIGGPGRVTDESGIKGVRRRKGRRRYVRVGGTLDRLGGLVTAAGTVTLGRFHSAIVWADTTV